MTPDRRILEAIRAAADPFGVAQPIDVAKRAGINIGALARTVPTLEKDGLIEVDEDAGTLRLTEAGSSKIASDAVEPATQPAVFTTGLGSAPQPTTTPATHFPPAMLAPAAPSVPPVAEATIAAPTAPQTEPLIGTPSASAEAPTTEPVVGQLDLLPAAGLERIPGEPVPKVKRPSRAKPKAKKPVAKVAGKKAGKVSRR